MKIKMGVVGLRFGRYMIEEIQAQPANNFFEIAAVCDLDAFKAEEMAKKLGVAAYYSLDSLLENKDVAVIALFTGPAGRAELIRKIIRAGKDVMTTKPFESNAANALEVLREAKGLGRVVHLNSPSPLPSEDLSIIFNWIEKYKLGRPIACRSDVWINYKEREQPSGDWQDDPELCPAAPIYRLGIYAISDLIRILGEPECVSVMQSRIFTGRPTSDNAQLSIKFKNNSIANIFASFCINDGHYYKNSMILNYDNGTIYKNVGPSKKGEPYKLEVVANDGEILDSATFSEHSGIYQWENFYKAVRGEKLPGEISPEEITVGVRIVEAMKKAQKTGGTVFC